MDVQIYIDSSIYSEIDLDEQGDALLADLSAWTKNKSAIKLLAFRPEEVAETWKLGLALQLRSKFKLKDPLNFLYELAKKYQCEFVVAEYDDDSDVAQEVCYFGFEEGRPDLHEIANYLGL